MPSILPNHNVTVTFYDVNHQELEKRELRTNEYGTFNGSFIAPRSGLLGQMSIRSSAGNTAARFRVEEYKRPKFEVSFEPVKESYRFDDEVTVHGTAKAYAGNVVDGAKVQYRVMREARFPYWPWWYRSYYNAYSEPQEIAFGETTTDAQGKFVIPFKALPDRSISKDQKPEFTYVVYADVTDITGETHSSQSRVRVGYIALSADISIKERYSRNDLKKLELTTKNLNGEFEAASGEVIVEKIEDPAMPMRKRYWEKPDVFVLAEKEFKQDFPDLPYKDEDIWQKRPAEKEVWRKSFNTESTKELSVDAASWPVGNYVATMKTKDKYGQDVEVKKYFSLYDLKDKKVPGEFVNFHIYDDKQYEPGETVRDYFGSAEKEVWLLTEVEHDGEITVRQWQKVKDWQEIELPVHEQHRGSFFYHFYMVKNNRRYAGSRTIQVPWSNKELEFEYSTFRDKLYPGQDEEWTIKVMGKKKDKVAAEMVAAMYDASLDAFAPNNWRLNLFPHNYPRLALQWRGFNPHTARLFADNWNKHISVNSHQYRQLNYFGFDVNRTFYGEDLYYMEASGPVGRPRMAQREMSAPAMEADEAGVAVNGMIKNKQAAEYSVADAGGDMLEQEATDDVSGKEEGTDLGGIPVRTNLEETVFFFPTLMTDADGNVLVKFKMKEALTKWKFLGLAHTKDLKFGTTTKEVVTQKELMVMPNAPRFMREGDVMTYTAKVSNLTENTLSGTAMLELFDATTMQPADQYFAHSNREQKFAVEGGQSTLLSWQVKIPTGKVPALVHRVVAKAGKFSDGEESALPILTNRILVTESKPLPVRGKEKKNFTFEHMVSASKSSTLQHHAYSLEFTSNPAWYAVQALPYLMEYPHECTEQIFNRYYANTLASAAANAHPKIKQVFDQWRNLPEDQGGTAALMSSLSKNQELKSALLEETPWVLQAQNEEQQKRNIALLFDLNRMANEQDIAMTTLAQRQLGNGGFAWFPGGRDSWYITQYIVEGMGHLAALYPALDMDNTTDNMLRKAVNYIDGEIVEHYERMQRNQTKMEDDHLNSMAIHYLYARSFFPNIELSGKTKEVHKYYLGQAEKYWLNKGPYMEGMLALALHRANRSGTPDDIVRSLRERAIKHDELGMYWKNTSGWYWYQLPIESHAMMIEVFDEVADDRKAVEEMRIWLLKNKQTNNWKTTKATAAATYALLTGNENWLLETEPVEIKIGGKKLDIGAQRREAGTGYFKTYWDGHEVNTDMAEIEVYNPNDVIAWGAAYWQYFEDLDKVTVFEETPLTLKKQLYKEVNTDKGPKLTEITNGAQLQQGDKVKVRIELRVDRPMEYVHMKDMRASGFEPINVLSQYKWQGGLGYYESTRDASTNFFISHLQRGTYVFEYPLRATHAGDFSNGITTIQCMYAPEFTSHSEGVRVGIMN